MILPAFEKESLRKESIAQKNALTGFFDLDAGNCLQ